MPCICKVSRIAIATPLGLHLVVGAANGHVVTSQFTRRNHAGAVPCACHSERSNVIRSEVEGRRIDEKLLRNVKKQVSAYFARKLERFELPLVFEGTTFQQEVWRCVAQLSFGEFVSYADIARALGHPLAHRGVALAMARTPLDLFIPAHRVVGADGRARGALPGSLRTRLIAFEHKWPTLRKLAAAR